MKKLTVMFLSLALLSGCSLSSNSLLMNTPTQEELVEAQESLTEAKAEISQARDEINQKEDITQFEKSVANAALDFADKFGISIAEKVVDYKITD